jgi:putative endonuclease
MTTAPQALGALGERVAGRWLRAHGWRVVAERFRSGHRDVDLVVQRGREVAFVEVKTRRGLRFGDPAAAVGWRKRRELTRSAQVWADRFGGPGLAYRFDVVAVLVTPAGVRIRHLENAFPAHAGGGDSA